MKINYNKIIYAILFIIVFFLLFPDNFNDFDIFFHLRYGSYFIENSTWKLDHSIFSWTQANKDWIYVNWISSSIFYLIQKIFSVKWLYTFKLVILALTFYLIGKHQKKIKNIHLNFLITTTFAIIISPFGMIIKPENFSIFFFSLIVFIYYYEKIYNKSYYFLYPLIFLIWVNCHGAFFVGLVFISIALPLEIIITKKNIAKNISILTSSFLLTFINPYGYKYHLSILNTFLSSNSNSNFSTIGGYLSSLTILKSSPLQNSKIFLSYFLTILAFLFLFTIFYSSKKYKQKLFNLNLILPFVFFAFSLIHIRNLFYFAIIFVFSIYYFLSKTDLNKNYFFKYNISLQIINIILVSIILLKFTFLEYDHSWFGKDLNEKTPKIEISFLKKLNKIQPIFNDYQIGSYLLWNGYPKFKVFIDSRFGPYYNKTYNNYISFIFNNKIGSLDNFQEKFKFNSAIIKISQKKLIKKFIYNPNWTLVFIDKNAVIFLYKIKFDEFKFINDLNINKYKSINNPIVLKNLFYILFHYNKTKAVQLKNIYLNNVNKMYYFRKKDIGWMEKNIHK